jgi:hypothetical protein
MTEPLSAAKTLVRVLSMENHTYLRAPGVSTFFESKRMMFEEENLFCFCVFCFVSGHNFSRATTGPKMIRALAPVMNKTAADWSILPYVTPTSTRIWPEKSAGAKAQLCLALYGTTKSRVLIQSQTLRASKASYIALTSLYLTSLKCRHCSRARAAAREIPSIAVSGRSLFSSQPAPTRGHSSPPTWMRLHLPGPREPDFGRS